MNDNRIQVAAILAACLALAACTPTPTPEVLEVTRIVEVVVTATEPRATATSTGTPVPTTVETKTPAASAVPTVYIPAGETATVTRVIDGDTIEVEVRRKAFRVRYIGINSPATYQTCGEEATAANAALVQGQTVTLVKDVSERDRYARLLRYVYLTNGVFVNAELVAEGFAQAVLYEPDSEHYDEFRNLEAQARNANLGCHPTGIFALLSGAGIATPALPVQDTPTPTQKPTKTLPPPLQPTNTEPIKPTASG